MKTIHIDVSRSYDVIISDSLLEQAGTRILSVLKKTCKIAIISDSNVSPLYEKRIKDSLIQAGFQVVSYTFPAGEASKNPQNYIAILNFLAENRLNRSDAVLALGGGVVGDMSGFVAATYLRGISYIQVPTSLLAMVDSSVGGKTAIDLPTGKNLVGAFCQPNLVLCDLSTLDTLPSSVFCDGCAEIVKYSILYDAELFSHLKDFGLKFDREKVISRCVELKCNVVMADEFDIGERQKLNLGHTIGHSIEALSNFTITHGQAVAIGIAIVTKAACSAIYGEVAQVLKAFHLPLKTDYTSSELFNCALSDKKCADGNINLIIPNAIGNCSIVPTKISELQSFIEEGL